MKEDFAARLTKAFPDQTIADISKRLGIANAAVRNYYHGRMPSAEVLVKIAEETSVSLTWLLTGQGDMYCGNNPPVSIGRFLEDRINEMVDQRLAEREQAAAGDTPPPRPFDVEAAIFEWDDPERVMSAWFRHEGREYPADYGVVFFRGWETFSVEDKIEAVRDAKRVLDRTLRTS